MVNHTKFNAVKITNPLEQGLKLAIVISAHIGIINVKTTNPLEQGLKLDIFVCLVYLPLRSK
jgi:hypothetical protein